MFDTIGRNTEGALTADVSPEYALAFQILDSGYPLPVDLEVELVEQGYDLDHLHDLFDI